MGPDVAPAPLDQAPAFDLIGDDAAPPADDLATSPDLRTESATCCGASCVDCTSAGGGTLCLSGVCGCQAAVDCPVEQACDVGVQACTPVCSIDQPCHLGCCATGTCASGTAASACGDTGGLCDSCNDSSLGKVCHPSASGGQCGCEFSADCPAGAACDPLTQKCGTSCSGADPCQGACCKDGQCQPGTATSACGMAGAGCLDCSASASGTACVATTRECGCNDAADCPSGQACSPTTHLCSTSCVDGEACNGGCCDGTVCVAGVLPSQCGASGSSCQSCAAAAAGKQCLPTPGGGGCGCQTNGDCATGEACDGLTKQCTTACAVGQPCNGGCCALGVCNAGTGATTCGADGNACASCAAEASGHQCRNAVCGCTQASDCPGGTACNLATHTCSDSCSITEACNGGCCDPGSNKCVAGTSSSVCGDDGGLCGGCGGSSLGTLCRATATGGACGCDGSGDCAFGTCDLASHACVTSCSGASPCQGACCSGTTCQAGDEAGACGAAGAACVDCANASKGHRCVAGTRVCGCNSSADCAVGLACDASLHECTASCSASQPCNQGCCDGATSLCVAGLTISACGGSGALCADCASSPNGTQCNAQSSGGACGCNATTDCPTGTACDLSTHACTDACSLTQACNDACCGSDGKCKPGTASASCGASGLCADCAAGTSGAVCVAATRTCGCALAADCPVGKACQANKTCTTSCTAAFPQPPPVCNGGCCAGGVCQAGTSAAQCGVTGRACTNCAISSNGSICEPAPNGGACGCDSTSDCQPGLACNTTTHLCTTSCSSTQPCRGGCCNGGVCNGTASASACGGMGTTCVDCRSNNLGHACVNEACGCNFASDCPGGYACDTSTKQCTKSCSATRSCNGGCCDSGTSLCVSGTATASCGKTGGLCGDCTGVATGGACLPTTGGGVCGCATKSDCPTGRSCNTTSKLCTTACTPTTQPCNGGCCNGSFQCVTGAADAQCGASGGACLNCASNPIGDACFGGTQCGCVDASDCPLGNACDTTTHQCTTTCSPTQLCNGACCDAGTSTCSGGSTQTACGTAGMCEDCTVAAAGTFCDTSIRACSCRNALDCSPGKACSSLVLGGGGVKACSANCDGSKPCNGGCCDGPLATCVTGTAAGACGSSGGTCAVCNNTNSLDGFACVTSDSGAKVCGCGGENDCNQNRACDLVTQACGQQCGDSTHSQCNSGCCTPFGICFQLHTQSQCSAPDELFCNNCNYESGGSECLTGGCGCTGPEDCAAGQACNLGTGQCGTACGAGYSFCSGATCDSGLCTLPGTTDGDCGLYHVDCAGAAYNRQCLNYTGTWTCGCNGPEDCPAGQACNLSAHACSTTCLDTEDLSQFYSACHDGCCRFIGAGQSLCEAGTLDSGCGWNGAECDDCRPTGDSLGELCLPHAGGGQCGCASDGDCPSGSTCNLGTSLCITSCVASCTTGCCDPNTGECDPGTSPTACGGGGAGQCVDCSASPDGHACVSDGMNAHFRPVCGCLQDSDCAVGSKCDGVARQCYTYPPACSPPAVFCGDSCQDCGAGKCVEGHCGCEGPEDCTKGYACNLTKKVCEPHCGAGYSACSWGDGGAGGCCSEGHCYYGNQRGACGSDGLACAACPVDKPTCSMPNGARGGSCQ